MTFLRKKEDFTCEHCGALVVGNGYTNHCPECFWSKHVDIEPGDRAEKCRGLMEPVAATLVAGEYTVTQRCQTCGYERRNRVRSEENLTALIAIAHAATDRYHKHT